MKIISVKEKNAPLFGGFLPLFMKSLNYHLNFFSLNAFANTDTELRLIAAAAIIGLSRGPPKI